MPVKVHEPLVRSILGGTAVTPEDHAILPDGPWIRYMRRWTGRKQLFCFLNKKSGRVSVAEWIKEPRYMNGVGVCTEIESMGAPPDWLPYDLPSPQRMREVSRPGIEVIQALQDHLKAQQREMVAKSEHTAKERYDAAKYMLKKGHEETGGRLLMGEIPFVGEAEGGEGLKELKETLIDLSRSL